MGISDQRVRETLAYGASRDIRDYLHELNSMEDSVRQISLNVNVSQRVVKESARQRDDWLVISTITRNGYETDSIRLTDAGAEAAAEDDRPNPPVCPR